MAWPKGKPRKPQADLGAATTASASAAANEPTPVIAPRGNHIPGRAVAMGRGGEELSRKRTVLSDAFHVPENQIPEGYEYQWNPVEVLGKPFSSIESSMSQSMYENGWRPVPAKRHAALFLTPGTSPEGPVIRDGLRLDERPKILSDEARAEELAKANMQMRDQKEQLGLARKMPEGFTRDNPNLTRAERQRTSRTYAPEPEAPRPRLEIDPAA